MERTKKEFIRYCVNVRGIFGRNRTVKFASVEVALVDPATPLNGEQARALYEGALARLGFRGGSATMTAEPAEIISFEDGGEVLSYMPTQAEYVFAEQRPVL